MKIDDELIDYLEKLSRLKMSDKEREITKKDLSKILNYIDTLNEITVSNCEEMSHPFAYTNNFRKDEITNSNMQKDVLYNTKEQKDGYFKVPKTVE